MEIIYPIWVCVNNYVLKCILMRYMTDYLHDSVADHLVIMIKSYQILYTSDRR